MFCRYLEIERCLRELMFSVQCLQRRSQQRHLSHTFLVKLKPCNSAHWHFPFQFPPSLRLLFQDISWLVTPLDFPELSQIENNSRSSEFFTVCQQLYNCHQSLLTKDCTLCANIGQLQFSTRHSLVSLYRQQLAVFRHYCIIHWCYTQMIDSVSVIHVPSHLFCLLLLPSLYLYPTPGSHFMSHSAVLPPRRAMADCDSRGKYPAPGQWVVMQCTVWCLLLEQGCWGERAGVHRHG